MSRIQRAFESQFRVALTELGARRSEEGVRWLLSRAARLASAELIGPTEALARVAEELFETCGRARKGRRGNEPVPTVFWCDAGLGGLARWLRAAGYVSRWEPGIDDASLLARATSEHAAVITTDGMLLERSVVTSGRVPVFWLPPACGVIIQLRLVLRRWNLPLREPLCMKCSGALERVDKEAVRDRIPPRTYRWLEEYYLCQTCGRLFWRGTHWHRIAHRLKDLGAS